MRIAVLNWTRRQAGGIERYLDRVLPALGEKGHEVAFVSEADQPVDREAIRLPPGAPFLNVGEIGTPEALDELRAWRPDLVYLHSVRSAELEEGAISLAPTVFYAHAYYGTCVSGNKAFSSPSPRPCSRVFGAACLAHYFPRRCGGLSPVTMLSSYRRESRRLQALRGCQLLLTNSNHMREEYIRHGFAQERVRVLPLPADGDVPPPLHPGAHAAADRDPGALLTLLFAGRMERLKGGGLLLAALPAVRRALGRPLRLVMAGDGPERGSWEAAARALEADDGDLRITFTGWAAGEVLAANMAEADLLVVPSLWPEPFGLVGPEAGRYGLPAAAFDVGGISDWLREGDNGALAPADPPTAAGLAAAIVRAVEDPRRHASLRRGAAAVAARFTLRTHVEGLTSILEDIHLLDSPSEAAGAALH
jgi:glycosyltransferase involved in cell wall biosynthesis